MLAKLTNTAAKINGEAPAPVPGDNTQARIQKINILWIPAFAGMTIYSGL
jgi:hypothetical protein